MTDLSDADLLERYVRAGSETAFAELVERHIGLVHSVALRRTASPECAQDITQAVFIILARKASSLNRKTILPGWLYHTARLTTANLQRAEAGRVRREQEAYMQSLQQDSPDALWTEIAPQLEEAMARLGADERDAIVLRYFQNKSFSEVGALMGKGEAAAKKRVQRAVEKLRGFFRKRGTDTNAETITRAISSHSIQPAPELLAQTVTAVALAKGATVSITTTTLIKGALKIMAWTKAKTALVATAAVLLATGTTTVTVKHIQRNNEDAKWDTGKVDSRILDKAPHIVRVIPTKFPRSGGSVSSPKGMLGINSHVKTMLAGAYRMPDTRTVFLASPPPAPYDFISNVGESSNEALQKEIQKQFDLVGRMATIETNALFLKVKRPNAPGLVPSKTRDNTSSASWYNGGIRLQNQNVGNLASEVENTCQTPIVDQTGLVGNFDINLKWNDKNDTDHQNFKQALLDQLGLELVPGTAPIDFLFVEKAK